MNRQIQKQGVRKWHGDTLVQLQSESLKALEKGLLGGQGNMVLSGCELTDNGDGTHNLSAGHVYIDGSICPFAGATNITLPQYLTKQIQEVEIREYADGQDKATVERHTAVLVSDKTGVTEYIEASHVMPTVQLQRQTGFNFQKFNFSKFK